MQENAPLLSGHNIHDPEWQKRTYATFHRKMYNVLFAGIPEFAPRPKSVRSSIPEPVQEPEEPLTMPVYQDPYDFDDSAQEDDKVTSKSTWTKSGAFEVYGYVSPDMMSADDPESDPALSNHVKMHLYSVSGDPNKIDYQFCDHVVKTAPQQVCKVFGAKATPLFEYKLKGTKGSYGHVFFVSDYEYAAIAPNVSRMNWMLAHISNGFSLTCQTVEKILKKPIPFHLGCDKVFESLVEGLKIICGNYVKRKSKAILQAQKDRSKSLRKQAPKDNPNYQMMETVEDEEHSVASVVSQQCETITVEKTHAEKSAERLLIQLLSHPVSIQYFNDACFRRLRRYIPDSKLLALPFQALDEIERPLEELEKELQINPVMNCFKEKHARPKSACPAWSFPAWDFPTLVRFIQDYDLEYPADVDLLKLVVLDLVNESHFKDNHVCVTFDMLFKKFKYWISGPHSKITLGENSVLWYGSGRAGCVPTTSTGRSSVIDLEREDDEKARRIREISCRKRSGYAGRNYGIYCDKSDRMVFDHTWLAADSGAKLARVLHDLAYIPVGMNRDEDVFKEQTGVIVLAHPALRHDLLMATMSSNGPGAEDCRIYVNSAYQTQGFFMYVAMRLFQRMSMLNQALGPIRFKKIPDEEQLCSEQRAFLSTLGYTGKAKNRLPNKPLVVLRGEAGRGKTKAIVKLCQAFEPHEVMVVSFENAHVGPIVKELPNVRRASITRLIYMHAYLCCVSIDEHEAACGLEGCLDQGARSKINEKSRYYNDMMELLDKQAKDGGYGANQDNINYDFPIRGCPLRRLKCVIVEEVGATAWEPFVVLLGILNRCCPDLRVLVACGDEGQLNPITYGHVLRTLMEALDSIELLHPHRQNSAPLLKLAAAAKDQDVKGLKFDGKQTIFIEADEKNIVQKIAEYHQRNNVAQNNSQVITHTNALRKEISKELEKQEIGKMQLDPEEQTAAVRRGQKVVFKRNIFSLGLNNNTILLVRAVVQVQLESVPEQIIADRKERDRLRNLQKKRDVQRNWAEESVIHAASQQFELTTSEMLIRSGNSPAQVIAPALRQQGGLDRDVRSHELGITTRIGVNLAAYLELTNPHRIPDGVFSSTPSFDASRQKILLPCGSGAISAMLKKIRLKPTGESVQQTQVRLISVGLTTNSFRQPFIPGRRIDKNAPKLLTMIMATPFESGTDINQPFDKGQLFFIPYEGAWFDSGRCGTYNFAQGKQWPEVYGAVLRSPYLTSNHLYTLFTRAQKKLVIFGSRQALEEAIKRVEPERFSDTADLLKVVYETFCGSGFDPVDYEWAIEQEVKENGCFGKMPVTFAQKAQEQEEDQRQAFIDNDIDDSELIPLAENVKVGTKRAAENLDMAGSKKSKMDEEGLLAFDYV